MLHERLLGRSGMTVIVRTLEELRCETAAWRRRGLTSALIPTMGALHDGHIALVRAGLARAQRIVATIFVNPKQFGPAEDFSRYPRDEAVDLALLERAGAHAVYVPYPSRIYSAGFATTVRMGGPAAVGLEDRFRPHFFDGVATIVAKLFIQAACDFAMFGEKDYQQLKVVSRMAGDLDLPTRVIGVDTVREPDGLAMSSRNRYLSQAERSRAGALYTALSAAAEAIRNGEDSQSAATVAARRLCDDGFGVDYVEARNAETLEPASPGSSIRLLAAAWLCSTRLIDNVPV